MDSIKKRVICILRLIKNAKSLPIEFQSDQKEISLVSGLIDEHYLTGSHAIDHRGVFIAAAVTGITISGHEYLERLCREEFQNSIKGRVLAILKLLGAFSLGLASRWIGKQIGIE